MPDIPALSRREAGRILTDHDRFEDFPTLRQLAFATVFLAGARKRPMIPANNFPGDVA